MTSVYPQLYLVPWLLLGVNAKDLLLLGHLHVGLMALSEVIHLHTHTHYNIASNPKTTDTYAALHK